MKFIECCKNVVSNGYMLIREKKGVLGEYDCKFDAGKKKGWIYLDVFTASAVTQVYDAISVANKNKFESLDAMSAINLTWKLIGGK